MILVYKKKWRKIDGFPKYEVSNYGEIRSFHKRGKSKKRILNPGANRDGYLRVYLYNNGERKRKQVHRLVLEAFSCASTEGMQACHNNGKPNENNIWNLRWDTPKANQADRIRHGTDIMAEKNGRAKLKPSDFPEIFKMFNDGVPKIEIGRRFNVSDFSIAKALKGKSWKKYTQPLIDKLSTEF